eukprot:TRINITY_DN103170_c0_g1_i1.p1 TRINITY_DN103170_c0_g1~~TRINITY_DN103170_c0_g1_i1.p1  ORF type:complete len:343 (+),score=45.87 TRINITY_DN103170_c0_g1_i1:143-1171(+)
MASCSSELPSPMTPLSTTKRSSVSPSKLRRKRFRKLAEARGREQALVDNEQERRALKRELEEMNVNMRKLNDRVLRSLPDVSSASGASPLSVGHDHAQQAVCPKCGTKVDDETSPCWCFEVACIHCHCLAIFCECQQQAMVHKLCDSCGFRSASDNSKLKWLRAMGFEYGQDPDEELARTGLCPACHEGVVCLVPNYTEGMDICGWCKRVDRQTAFAPCESENCIGDEEGMFHECCMKELSTGQLQCAVCFDAGVPLESALGEEEEEDDIESTDETVDTYRCVNYYAGLYTGMPYECGSVLELYPGLDKLTVRRDGGVIEHLKISRVLQKLNLTTEGLNGMD